MSVNSRTLNLHIQGARCVSIWSSLHQRSHYDTLGVAPGASQADIKSAFYKLSKKHHPDANVNDPTATAKFQEISEAYEILGNEDARKRYDVGMGPISRHTRRTQGFKTPDDPKAAFYKSRLQQKMSNSPTTGRSYDFDEWTKQHYTDSVHRNRTINSFSSRNTVPQESHRKPRPPPSSLTENKIAYFSISILLLSFGLLTIANQPDSPRSK